MEDENASQESIEVLGGKKDDQVTSSRDSSGSDLGEDQFVHIGSSPPKSDEHSPDHTPAQPEPEEQPETETNDVEETENKILEMENDSIKQVVELQEEVPERLVQSIIPEKEEEEDFRSDESVGLRHRKKELVDSQGSGLDSASTASLIESSSAVDTTNEGQKLQGITPDGLRFAVPPTPPAYRLTKKLSDITLGDWIQNTGFLNIILLFVFPRWMWLWYFLFWRLMYNVGIGYLLYQQSKTRFITKFFKEQVEQDTMIARILKIAVTQNMKHSSSYSFEKSPPEFNAWLSFRMIVDVVLANDLASYIGFCLVSFETPTNFSPTLVISYIIGILLCGLTLWAKTDAYRVVKDFAWYWGDFFFLIDQQLTFDRVFAMFPHPMYTIGYAFFYGASLLTQSYTVLYVSLLAHLLQLSFLSFVENPHIEKTYPEMCEDTDANSLHILYDKQAGYFRKDLIVFRNFNIFRAADLFMLFCIIYVVLSTVLLNPPTWFIVLQVLVWRIWHSLGLGYILHRQSKDGNFVRHFLQNGATKQEAFDNWKCIYNFSLTITWTVFFACAYHFWELPQDLSQWQWFICRNLLGLMLIALNVWSSVSTFEVLGEFGFFYGDFFIEEVPAKLYYTGIYRFINNPDNVTGFAGYYGLALMSGSWTMLFLTWTSQICNLFLTHFVERKHMKKLYGDKLRDKSGIQQEFSKMINDITARNEHAARLARQLSEYSQKAKLLQNSAKQEVMTQLVEVGNITQHWLDQADELLEKVKKSASERARQQARMTML